MLGIAFRLTLAAIAVIAPVGGLGAEAATQPPAPRRLVVARDLDVTTLDPARAYCNTCPIYLAAVYDTLVGVDPTEPTRFVPRLAESWRANEDHTSYTFTLDPAARFADGSSVTASDVKFSWDRLAGLGGPASYLIFGADVAAPDERTVVVTFEQPNSAFLAVAAAPYLGIVNAALAAANGATTEPATDAAESWFATTSAGSGPFVLASSTTGVAVELARSESHWRAPSPFAGVTLRHVSDPELQLQQLRDGAADIAMNVGFDILAELAAIPTITAQAHPSANFLYLALSPGAVGGEALADPAVREAIRRAIDYEGLLAATVGGHGRVQASPLPDGFAGSAELPLPARDLAAARELLAEAGVDELTLRVAYPTISVYGVDFEVMLNTVQADLAEAGIELRLEPLEFAAWLAEIDGAGIPVTAMYFGPDHVDSSQYVAYFGRVAGSTWLARSGLERSQEQTDLLVQALASAGAERDSFYTALGEMMIDDAVILPLVNPDIVLAHAADLTGVSPSICCTLELAAIAAR